MTKLEKGILHGSTAAVGLTGLAFAAFKHLMVNDDPFSAVNHPLQPWALRIHVLLAPLLVFGIGVVFRDHVLAKLRNGAPPRAKRVGLLTFVLAALLAGSGYLIQVVTAEDLRRWSGWVHLGLGTLYLLAYGVHLVTVPRRAPAGREETAPAGGGAVTTGLRIATRRQSR